MDCQLSMQEILMKLYHHNHLPDNWTVRAYQPGSRKLTAGHAAKGLSSTMTGENLDQWGGGRARRLLQAAYTVAFLCMLRFDEVLKIQAHDLCVHENGVILRLPFRKTHQNGGQCPNPGVARLSHTSHILNFRHQTISPLGPSIA
jgi:hypothetical protein